MQIANIGGINTKISPLLKPDDALLSCVNMDSDYIGGKTKRAGLELFLNNPDASQVNNVYEFEAGTYHTLIRMSGTVAYYYDINNPGTAWTPMGNGTFSGGGRLGATTMYDTMIVGNGLDATRHTTNGTSFTNTSLAPLAKFFTNNFGRVYAAYNQTMFWSSANSVTDWSTAGASDSSSIQIPGSGTVNGIFSGYNRVLAHKSSGEMHRWDSYAREKVPGDLGPTSHWAGGNMDDVRIYPNRRGVYAFTGSYPKIISTPIEKQFYNRLNTGIDGSLYENMAGGEFYYQYFLSAGTITDPLTRKGLNNAVIVYDYLHNDFNNYQYPFLPTCYSSYTDANGDLWQLLGDSTGKIYRVNNTATSDNGTAIEAYFEGFSTMGNDFRDKDVSRVWVHASPGCQAKIQVSMTNSMLEMERQWVDIGDVSQGVKYLELPKTKNRGKYMFYRAYESSSDAPWTFLGITADFQYVGDK